ncbi:hypothetical protein NH340_JMT06664 [Sarcoptes scabiei]|nr:hypothetical protein NH340_JMT06664 [Sarcoptes scabiei]
MDYLRTSDHAKILSEFRKNSSSTIQSKYNHLDIHLLETHLSNLMREISSILQNDRNDNEYRLLRINALKTFQMILQRIHAHQFDSISWKKDLNIWIIEILIKKISTNTHPLEVRAVLACLIRIIDLFPACVSIDRILFENKFISIAANFATKSDQESNLNILGFCFGKYSLSGPINDKRFRQILSRLMISMMTYTKCTAFTSIKKPIRKFCFDPYEPFDHISFDSQTLLTIPEQMKYFVNLHFISSAMYGIITNNYFKKFPLPIEAILECLNELIVIAMQKSIFQALKLHCKNPLIIFDSVFIVLNGLIERINDDRIQLRLDQGHNGQNFSDHHQLSFSDHLFAIRALNSFLNFSLKNLNRNQLRRIHYEIIDILLHIIRDGSNLIYPYRNKLFRKEIYESVRFLIVGLQHVSELPLETYLTLLHEAKNFEKSKEIASIIENILQTISFVLLSRLPIENRIDYKPSDRNKVDKTLENFDENQIIDLIRSIRSNNQVLGEDQNGLTSRPEKSSEIVQDRSNDLDIESLPIPSSSLPLTKKLRISSEINENDENDNNETITDCAENNDSRVDNLSGADNLSFSAVEKAIESRNDFDDSMNVEVSIDDGSIPKKNTDNSASSLDADEIMQFFVP